MMSKKLNVGFLLFEWVFCHHIERKELIIYLISKSEELKVIFYFVKLHVLDYAHILMPFALKELLEIFWFLFWNVVEH